jgi:hypothetical protein
MQKAFFYMKIAKLMLLSLSIFAVAGGVLAFKARSFSNKYCVGTNNGVNTFVPTFSGAHKFTVDLNVDPLIYRTSRADGLPVEFISDCVDLTTTTQNLARITSE